MKLLVNGATFVLSIAVCFSLTEADAASQTFSVKSAVQQSKTVKKRPVSRKGEKPKPDSYCPDKSERGRVCGNDEVLARSCDGLMVAAEGGDLKAVRRLLEKHADVNARGPGGHTPLTLAAAAGHLAIVQALLSAGADPNARGASFHFGEFSALMSAMNRCNEDWMRIMDAMIAAGAEVNPKVHLGRSPLTYAVELKDLVIINALLARGADVNVKDVLGMTALMTATLSSSPSVQVVKLLLKAGADPKVQNNQGETALALLDKHAQAGAERNEIACLLRQSGSR